MYTNQGEAPLIDDVNDAEDLESTREAFSLLGEHSAPLGPLGACAVCVREGMSSNVRFVF